eukprot:765191-Hanusia_phi.AAC.7
MGVTKYGAAANGDETARKEEDADRLRKMQKFEGGRLMRDARWERVLPWQGVQSCDNFGLTK